MGKKMLKKANSDYNVKNIVAIRVGLLIRIELESDSVI